MGPAPLVSQSKRSVTPRGHKAKVLVLSRSFPNSVMDVLGLWVEGPVRHSTHFCEPKVISPVPYCPPLPGLPEHYSRFRKIDAHCWRNGVEVFHPRFFVGPGYSLYNFEWMLYYAGIRRLVDRIHRQFEFDLIHAHFTYPDGVVAAHLGRRYGVPVVITEHVPWEAWRSHPRVLRRAGWAAQRSACHISVSESVRRSVANYTGEQDRLVVVPNSVDGSVFTSLTDGRERIPNQILFAGAVRPVKGVDLLLRSLRLLVERRRDVNLVVAGEAFYGGYRKEEVRLRQMVKDLGLEERVKFVGKQAPPALARYMRESAMLVLPSRLESFGMVLVEALACGTPVVSTRCGGPQDIVNDEVGILVPPDDPTALADAMENVLDHPQSYDPDRLRAYALRNFGLDAVGARLERVYENALRHFRRGAEIALPDAAGGPVAG
jgi:teichuronic acid biosynthesis glycosyltransferase TuaC